MTKSQQDFLMHLHILIDYWDKQNYDARGKMEGLAFTILTMLDGDDGQFPNGFALRRRAAKGKEGGDLAGCLHEYFYIVKKKLSPQP